MSLPHWRWRRWTFGAALLATVTLAWRSGSRHLHAAAMLARFASEKPEALGSSLLEQVDESLTSFRAGEAEVFARLYRPHQGKPSAGMVLVHGIHQLGMNEPRLIRFAQTLASAGITILTPEVKELADYRVDPRSIETLGAAVYALSGMLAQGDHRPRVGLMGLSFAGGLALLAAADPRYANEVGFVVAVGAHDDLARVSRFFVTDEIERPDGSTGPLKAHEYGPLVLVYNHLPDFFSPEDVPLAQEALRLWLAERREEAKQRANALSQAGRERLNALFEDHRADLKPALLKCIAKDRDAMAIVSPAGHLASLSVPTLLLHGAEDNVIPASETLWLVKDIPQARLRNVLISQAVQHVELRGKPTLGDELSIVHFLAEVLEEADVVRP